ncbi:MAG: hypothetical protein A2X40_01545 [Elusimicrobia bacterium GWC2_65_9]|nr:MAG: hypothetical protein A2X37_08420 [Elusimicrobia bacterium GWA2_66_18]OGR71570.1 MAG: hypothetical protein A2X40_01545 [Elusimicrobia bacterium GWC2_65_9]
MTNLPIEISNVRLFDVLKNALTSEFGEVVGIEGDKLALVVRSGEIVRFKFTRNFTRVSDEETLAFRALTRALRRERLRAHPRKRKGSRKPSVKAEKK